MTFAAGESSKEVSVSEKDLSSVPLRYRYQCTRKLYYYFELMDTSGDRLTSYMKTITTGGDTNNDYYLNNIRSYLNDGNISYLTYFNEKTVSSGSGNHYHDEPYTPPTDDVETKGTLEGYVYIDDSYDYQYKSATVYPSWLYVTNRAGATGEWHKLAGNKLLASVVFTEKEKDDGYAYVQILIGNGSTAYDTGYDPNKEVNDPVNSIYKACFELKKGSGAYSGNGKWIFPHTYDHVNEAEQISEITHYNDRTAFWMTDSYLWQQKFRSEGYRAGRFNNAFVLDPDISCLTVRFDCGGSDDDTYGYKDLFVRWALVDNTAPTVIKDDIKVNPGLHAKGNYVSISIPFSEPVHLDHSMDRYILHTSWGGLVADAYCDNCNVVTFSGVITANAGTALTINSIETTYNPSYGSSAAIRPIRDIMGQEFGGDVSKSFSNLTVDGIYKISYKLNGGTLASENPTKYTQNSGPITLINPTRERYVFAGWTGTGLDGPTMTVTIPSGSTGDRSYSATWAPDIAAYWTGDGSSGNPYVISTPEGLEFLAFMVEESNSFQYKYFELGDDIDMSGISGFNGIGTRSNKFNGIFDGKGHSISNFTITANGQDDSGLFRYKDSGSLKNIAVRNASISGTCYVGAILGYSSVISLKGCSVSNCTIEASVTGGNSFVGAMTGYMINADIQESVVDGCSVRGSGGTLYAGGFAGYSGTGYTSRSISDNIIANCTLDGTAASESYIGTAVGWLNGDGSNTGSMFCGRNFVYNTTTSGTNSLYGKLHQNGITTGSHYRLLTCGTDEPVSDVFTVSASLGIKVSGTAAVSYGGTDFFSPDTGITVSAASGYTLNSVSYTAAGGSETPATYNGNGKWSFTIENSDVTINSVPVKPVSLAQGTKDGVTAWWGSFYDGSTNYTLSEGAAYTLGADNKLYRLGTDGLTIPKGVAVVIIAPTSSATISPAGTADLGITDNAYGGNKLHGSDSAVSVSGLSGTPYVLSLDGAAIGFREYTGASIPAGKAYFVND